MDKNLIKKHFKIKLNMNKKLRTGAIVSGNQLGVAQIEQFTESDTALKIVRGIMGDIVFCVLVATYPDEGIDAVNKELQGLSGSLNFAGREVLIELTNGKRFILSASEYGDMSGED